MGDVLMVHTPTHFEQEAGMLRCQAYSTHRFHLRQLKDVGVFCMFCIPPTHFLSLSAKILVLSKTIIGFRLMVALMLLFSYFVHCHVH